jgi:DNA-binding response OmpR family regulator
MSTGQPTVLLVDDEKDVVDVYALAFSQDYEVRKAYSGDEALEKVADADVVLLDRRMPGLSGREVLSEIRDREVGVRVAMVTAVDPDYDIAEMPFDAYLTKPVGETELRETVEDLLTLSEYDEQVRERFAVAEKLGALETEKPHEELVESDEYQRLNERATALEAQTAETFGRMGPETFEKAMWDIDDPETGARE